MRLSLKKNWIPIFLVVALSGWADLQDSELEEAISRLEREKKRSLANAKRHRNQASQCQFRASLFVEMRNEYEKEQQAMRNAEILEQKIQKLKSQKMLKNEGE